MTTSTKIALIGAGNMGGALVAGWLRTKRSGVAPQDLIIVDPAPSDAVQALIDQYQIRHVLAPSLDLAGVADLIVLAVKPQALDKLAPLLVPLLSAECGVLSVMAGITMTRLATVEWVTDERLIGAATAVSGSGPAYVFLLAEALAGAGFAEGLPRELADKLARQTIIGAGALLAGSDKTPQELRRLVTSPGGTTQAAIDILMGGGGGLPELVRQAVSAAERRSRQMGAEPPGR